MTIPTNHDLTLDELLIRGWQVQTSSSGQRHRGNYLCTLVLPDHDGGVVHVVTGQGETAEAAKTKVVELVNQWRQTVT